MAVFAHAQKNQIKDGGAALIGRHSEDFRIGLGDSDFRRQFAAKPMDLSFGNIEGSEQKIVSQFEIAFRVGRRNATLIRPEKLDVAERHVAGQGFFSRGEEKFLRDAAAGKRDAMRPARAIGAFDFLQPRGGGGRRQGVRTGKGNEFELFHRSYS